MSTVSSVTALMLATGSSCPSTRASLADNGEAETPSRVLDGLRADCGRSDAARTCVGMTTRPGIRIARSGLACVLGVGVRSALWILAPGAARTPEASAALTGIHKI